MRSTLRLAMNALSTAALLAGAARGQDAFAEQRRALEEEYLAAAAADDVAWKAQVAGEIAALDYPQEEEEPAAPPPAGPDATAPAWNPLDAIVERPTGPNSSNKVVLNGEIEGSLSTFFAEGGRKASITRKSDGTVEIAVEEMVGGGVDVSLVEAHGKIRVGDRHDTLGLGVDASAKGGVRHVRTETWTFREDETAAMVALLAQEGIEVGLDGVSLTPGLMVLGPLADAAQGGLEGANDVIFGLEEKMTGVKDALSVSGETDPSLKALIDIVQLEGKVTAEGSIEQTKGADGHWDATFAVKGEVEGAGSLMGVGPGGAVGGEWKLTVDETTADVEKLELVYTIKNDGTASWDQYEDFFKESMDGAAPTFTIEDRNELEVTFTLTDPEDHVVEAVRDFAGSATFPDPGTAAMQIFIHEVNRHGQIVVVEKDTGSFGIGGEGAIGAGGQKVELGGVVEGESTSAREIWRKVATSSN